MDMLSQLSSQVGDRAEYSNRKVVLRCLEQPSLLEEIVMKKAARALLKQVQDSK